MATGKYMVGYLDRKRIQFFGGPLNGVISLPQEAKLVADLEVLDREGLTKQVAGVLKENFPNGKLVLVLADEVVFFKELAGNLTGEQKSAGEKEFYSSVPFERLATKMIKTATGYQIVAVNWELCEAIADGLVGRGVILEAVIPAFATGMEQKGGLTSRGAGQILGKLPKLGAFSLYQRQEVELKEGGGEQTQQKSKLVPILIVVFLLLLAFLVILLLTR